jgi:hypothetical protein
VANDIASTEAPVVEIAAGKLGGAQNFGIYSFKAVPYGVSTAGHNRFKPPEPQLPWPGYGTRSPMPAARGNCLIAPSGAPCSKLCSGRRTPHPRARTA